jgi:Fe-Mn family superoxide dismutase
MMLRTAALLLIARASAQNLPLPPLPYDYNALEPHIDEATMRVHHLKHHQTYTDKLNAALGKLRADATNKHLAKMGVDTLLKHLDDVPEELRGAVRNAGGGFVNHAFFFRTLSPSGGGEPAESSPLHVAIKRAFGTFDAFKRMFALAALEVFGSGWAWLVYDTASSSLKVSSTANQDTPAMKTGSVPLLGIDVWEHAYYLKHQSNRKAYVDEFWAVVSWPEVEDNLSAAVDGADQGKAEL